MKKQTKNNIKYTKFNALLPRSPKSVLLTTLALGLVVSLGVALVPGFIRSRTLTARAGANTTYLLEGECLSPGQAIFSNTNPNSPRSALVMQGDGNLVVYNTNGQPTWASSWMGGWGSYACMQTDGHFVLYDAYWRPTWYSRTANFGKQQGLRYVLQFTTPTSGDIKIATTSVAPNGFVNNGFSTLWRSSYGGMLYLEPSRDGVNRLPAGRSNYELMPRNTALISPNGRYKLIHQTDGNLVIYNAVNRPVWATNTFNTNSNAVGGGIQYGAAFGVGLSNNGVGVRAPASWFAGKWDGNRTAAVLSMQDDGNLVVYDEFWQPIWASWTNGR